MYSKIIGTGGYLPSKILTNKDLESIVDTTEEWIFERTGIKQRHIADDKETSSSMAIQASLKNLTKKTNQLRGCVLTSGVNSVLRLSGSVIVGEYRSPPVSL